MTTTTGLEQQPLVIHNEESSDPLLKSSGSVRGRVATCLQKTKHACTSCDARAGWAALAVLIMAFAIVGIGGSLVYKDVLKLTLTGTGTMSQAAGFYAMLAGFGAVFIVGVLTAIHQVVTKRPTSIH